MVEDVAQPTAHDRAGDGADADEDEVVDPQPCFRVIGSPERVLEAVHAASPSPTRRTRARAIVSYRTDDVSLSRRTGSSVIVMTATGTPRV